MSKVVLALTSIVVFAIVGLVATAFFVPSGQIAAETYKALLQLIVIGAVGHVVSLLVTKANNERQELLQLNELRKTLLEKLNVAFVQVKKVRRLTRATASKRTVDGQIEYFLNKDRFHSYMQSLNEVQLELELVSKDLTTYRNLFKEPDKLVANINSMEEYLNRIIDEYEHNIVDEASDPPGTLPLKSFSTLNDLLGFYKTSKFRPQFVHTYYASLDGIRKDLSHLKVQKEA